MRGGRLRGIGRVSGWIAGLTALAAAGVLFSFFLVLKIGARTSQVRVPDFTGRTEADAAAMARSVDLRLEVTQQRHDPGVASGRILQQVPAAGTPVRRGRKVQLAISLGGRTLTVPRIVGQAARKVEIELAHGDLVPGDEARAPSRDVAAGIVVAQVPPAGVPVVPGTRIHRLVSAGREAPRWVMPDLEGRSLALVEGWTTMSGLRKGTVRRVDAPGRSAGTIVGQLPLAGHPVSSRDVIELTVAR